MHPGSWKRGFTAIGVPAKNVCDTGIPFCHISPPASTDMPAPPPCRWLKIRALAECHDWDGLDAFAAERKSPIGWEPFLEVARKHGAPRDVHAR